MSKRPKSMKKRTLKELLIMIILICVGIILGVLAILYRIDPLGLF